jgi:hypothetical protein
VVRRCARSPVTSGIRAAATAVTLPSAPPELAKILRTKVPAYAYADGATQDSVRRPTVKHLVSPSATPVHGRNGRKGTDVLEELQVQITAAQERILAAIEAEDP